MRRTLAALMRAIRVPQNEYLVAHLNLHRSRARLLATLSQKSDWCRFDQLFVATGLVSACFLLAWHSWTSESTTNFGPPPEDPRVDEWLIAPPDLAKRFNFTDGTQVDLRPGSLARITDVSSKCTRIAIAHGSAEAEVRPHLGSCWVFDNGPFQVKVVGAVFEMLWQPNKGQFALTLHRGTLSLTGPVVGAEQTLREGDHVNVNLGSNVSKSSSLEERPKQ